MKLNTIKLNKQLIYIVSALMVLFIALVPMKSISSLPMSFAPLVKKTLPAVVNIKSVSFSAGAKEKTRNLDIPEKLENLLDNFFKKQFNQPKGQNIQGSGFIFSKSGLVLTNNHVVLHADEIKVILQDGTTYFAELKGTDSLTDLAVLQIKDAKGNLPTLKFGNSDKSEVGDWVIAIGNPLGLGGTVTKGIISARSRNIKEGPYDDYIQTDTPINHGNSGGPLIDMNGDVIGINTVIISPTGGSIGLGFAIPSKLAKNIAYQLSKTGMVRRAWLGVSMRQVDPKIAESLGLRKTEGVIITDIQSASPADKSGVKLGDILLSVNGVKIIKKKRLPVIIAGSPLGKKIDIVVFRNNKKIKLNVVLVERTEKIN